MKKQTYYTSSVLEIHKALTNVVLFGLLPFANVKCKLINRKSNSYQPDKGYFTQDTNIKTNAIIVSTHTCHTCMSSLHVCTSQQLGRKLKFEYISMINIENSTIVPNKVYLQANLKDPVCKAKTQHFGLNQYNCNC